MWNLSLDWDFMLLAREVEDSGFCLSLLSKLREDLSFSCAFPLERLFETKKYLKS